MQNYQVWIDSESTTLATEEKIQLFIEENLLSANAKLLHQFSASTLEEARSIYNLRMGFEPYQPPGRPSLCPNGCGAYYYPEGSGRCPNCGEV